MPTTAIIHCGGIFLRKSLPLKHRMVSAEWSLRTIPQRNHSPTVVKHLNKMKNLILFLLPISIFFVSCDKPKNSYEIGLSDVLHKTFFKNQNCNSDVYYNIIIRNDTLLVDGKLQNAFGNYKGILNDTESEYLSELIKKINPKDRKEKDINPTTGMTALIIKESGKTLDSLVDFKIEWNQTDLDLFNYIGKLICEKELKKINDSIIYPTWEMIKPPE